MSESFPSGRGSVSKQTQRVLPSVADWLHLVGDPSTKPRCSASRSRVSLSSHDGSDASCSNSSSRQDVSSSGSADAVTELSTFFDCLLRLSEDDALARSVCESCSLLSPLSTRSQRSSPVRLDLELRALVDVHIAALMERQKSEEDISSSSAESLQRMCDPFTQLRSHGGVGSHGAPDSNATLDARALASCVEQYLFPSLSSDGNILQPSPLLCGGFDVLSISRQQAMDGTHTFVCCPSTVAHATSSCHRVLPANACCSPCVVAHFFVFAWKFPDAASWFHRECNRLFRLRALAGLPNTVRCLQAEHFRIGGMSVTAVLLPQLRLGMGDALSSPPPSPAHQTPLALTPAQISAVDDVIYGWFYDTDADVVREAHLSRGSSFVTGALHSAKNDYPAAAVGGRQRRYQLALSRNSDTIYCMPTLSGVLESCGGRRLLDLATGLVSSCRSQQRVSSSLQGTQRITHSSADRMNLQSPPPMLVLTPPVSALAAAELLRSPGSAVNDERHLHPPGTFFPKTAVMDTLRSLTPSWYTMLPSVDFNLNSAAATACRWDMMMQMPNQIFGARLRALVMTFVSWSVERVTVLDLPPTFIRDVFHAHGVRMVFLRAVRHALAVELQERGCGYLAVLHKLLTEVVARTLKRLALDETARSTVFVDPATLPLAPQAESKQVNTDDGRSPTRVAMTASMHAQLPNVVNKLLSKFLSKPSFVSGLLWPAIRVRYPLLHCNAALCPSNEGEAAARGDAEAEVVEREDEEGVDFTKVHLSDLISYISYSLGISFSTSTKQFDSTVLVSLQSPVVTWAHLWQRDSKRRSPMHADALRYALGLLSTQLHQEHVEVERLLNAAADSDAVRRRKADAPLVASTEIGLLTSASVELLNGVDMVELSIPLRQQGLAFLLRAALRLYTAQSATDVRRIVADRSALFPRAFSDNSAGSTCPASVSLCMVGLGSASTAAVMHARQDAVHQFFAPLVSLTVHDASTADVSRYQVPTLKSVLVQLPFVVPLVLDVLRWVSVEDHLSSSDETVCRRAIHSYSALSIFLQRVSPCRPRDNGVDELAQPSRATAGRLSGTMLALPLEVSRLRRSGALHAPGGSRQIVCGGRAAAPLQCLWVPRGLLKEWFLPMVSAVEGGVELLHATYQQCFRLHSEMSQRIEDERISAQRKQALKKRGAGHSREDDVSTETLLSPPPPFQPLTEASVQRDALQCACLLDGALTLLAHLHPDVFSPRSLNCVAEPHPLRNAILVQRLTLIVARSSFALLFQDRCSVLDAVGGDVVDTTACLLSTAIGNLKSSSTQIPADAKSTGLPDDVEDMDNYERIAEVFVASLIALGHLLASTALLHAVCAPVAKLVFDWRARDVLGIQQQAGDNSTSVGPSPCPFLVVMGKYIFSNEDLLRAVHEATTDYEKATEKATRMELAVSSAGPSLVASAFKTKALYDAAVSARDVEVEAIVSQNPRIQVCRFLLEQMGSSETCRELLSDVEVLQYPMHRSQREKRRVPADVMANLLGNKSAPASGVTILRRIPSVFSVQHEKGRRQTQTNKDAEVETLLVHGKDEAQAHLAKVSSKRNLLRGDAVDPSNSAPGGASLLSDVISLANGGLLPAQGTAPPTLIVQLEKLAGHCSSEGGVARPRLGKPSSEDELREWRAQREKERIEKWKLEHRNDAKAVARLVNGITDRMGLPPQGNSKEDRNRIVSSTPEPNSRVTPNKTPTQARRAASVEPSTNNDGNPLGKLKLTPQQTRAEAISWIQQQQVSGSDHRPLLKTKLTPSRLSPIL